MAARKILVTGANGQLGKEFRKLSLQFPQYTFLFAGHSDLAIEDVRVVNNYFKKNKLFVCINCAAYTAVDKAETERELAQSVNSYATGILANACLQNQTQFIHISTDYVFDGNSSTPYKEGDETNPVNHYGATKLLGERSALKTNPSAIIIRTSWVYSEYGNNFVKTMMRLMKERESINVVSDQVGSPTYAADLAETVMKMVSLIDGAWPMGGDQWVAFDEVMSGESFTTSGRIGSIIEEDSPLIKGGVYHYSNDGSISWYEFASAIKELTGSSCKVNPITTDQYPTPAKRPKFSLLDKTKIKEALGIEIPQWKDSLVKCLERIQNSGT